MPDSPSSSSPAGDMPLSEDFLVGALTEDATLDDDVDPAFAANVDGEYGQFPAPSPQTPDPLPTGSFDADLPTSSEAALSGSFGSDLLPDVSSDSFSGDELADEAARFGYSHTPDSESGDVESEMPMSAEESAGLEYLNANPGGSIYDTMTDGEEQPAAAAPVPDDDTPGTAFVLPKRTENRGLPSLGSLSRRARLGIILIVLILVVVLASVALRSCGSSVEPTAAPAYTPATTTAPAAAPSQDPNGAPVGDGPIPIKEATSRCKPGSSDPMNAFDSKLDTAWICVLAYPGVAGQVLRVKFDGSYIVTGVAITPGFERKNTDGTDEWIKHQTVAEVSYEFNDPKITRYVQETLSLRSGAQTAINPPVLASAMVVTVKKLAAPTGASGASPTTESGGLPGLGGDPQPGSATKIPDFAVSSITVYGHKAR